MHDCIHTHSSISEIDIAPPYDLAYHANTYAYLHAFMRSVQYNTTHFDIAPILKFRSGYASTAQLL